MCACLLLPAAAQPALPVQPPLLELPDAQLQPAGGPAERITLPWRIYRDERVFTRYRMTMAFDAPAALVAVRNTLALDSWPDGGRIALNGVEVADVGTSSEDRVVRFLRPFAFNLPAGLLREQHNELVFEWGSRETLVLMPLPRIGAREVIEPLVERKLFWEHTVVPGSTVFATVIFLVTGAVWWLQRSRDPGRDYGLFVLSAFGWILFNTALLWTPLPVDWFVWRRAIGFFGIGLFVMGMWMSLVRLSEPDGGRSPRFEALCWAWIAAAPLIVLGGFVLTGDTHGRRSEAVWAAGGALLGAVPLLRVPLAAWRRHDGRLLLLTLFVIVAMLLAAREAAVYVLRDPIGTVHLGLQLLAPLWLTVAAGVLVQDFVRSLRTQGLERAEVDRRLAEREAELARLHQRERELAAVAERQRIMQDMHDGLGSQLVSSLSMAERGELGPAQTAELLRGCIDDLRLAIDTMTDAEVHLAVTAGDLRFRMEPRLRAAGLRVRWDMQGLPDALCLPGSTALPLLRVLQEALANALKHSGAQLLEVRLMVQEGALCLEVQDDGRGFDADLVSRGKGLSGMHKRARALDARLDVKTIAGGTLVSLRMPLGVDADASRAADAGPAQPPRQRR